MPWEEEEGKGAEEFPEHIALALAVRQVDEVEVHRVFSGCLPAVCSRKQPTKPQGDLWDKTVVADNDQSVLSVLEE